MRRKQRYCVGCGSKKTKRYGHSRGVQRYRCLDCGRQFNDRRRKRGIVQKKIWEDYVFHKQTVRELEGKYGKDRRTIQRYLREYIPPKKQHCPRSVHIVVDATYFGERKEDTSWCVAVARDHESQEELVWEFAQTESTFLYRSLREQLEEQGYIILSVTGDGFSGIRSAFGGIPYQMCHVHMERLVTKGTTRNPQTEAGQVLLALVRTLHHTTKKTFTKRLTHYTQKYIHFLNERTTNPLTGEKYWTHKALRKAHKSLLHHSKYLFTYSANTHIAKTTNSLEARFSHIKTILGTHRGLSYKQKKKVIHSLLLASTIAPDRKTLSKIL